MHSCNTTPTFRTTLQQFGRQRHWMGLAQRRSLQAISGRAGKCRSGATSSPNTPLSAQYNNLGSTTLARLAVRCPDSMQRSFIEWQWCQVYIRSQSEAIYNRN